MKTTIPKGYNKLGTKVGKKSLEGQITPDKEYILVDNFSGHYGFIGDDDKVHYVDIFGGWFK